MRNKKANANALAFLDPNYTRFFALKRVIIKLKP